MLSEIPTMIDLKLIFDQETMLRLSNGQFCQLKDTGSTISEYAPAKKYSIDENFFKLYLSFDNSVSKYFFEFEPQQDIDKMIRNSYLTYFYPKTGEIELIKDFDQPLGDVLIEKRFDITNMQLFDKSTFKENQNIFSDPLNNSATEELIGSGNFKGQISCCECGEP